MVMNHCNTILGVFALSAAGLLCSAISVTAQPAQKARQEPRATQAAASSIGVATSESWPMFRGNPGLTGVSPATLPNSLSLLWTYKTGGPVKSSPAISGGKVFIGSDDKALHCIDLKSGKKIWTLPTQGEVE